MKKTTFILKNKPIPTQLTEMQFAEFVLPHLSVGKRGPKCSIPLRKIFNYILQVIYTGMQWHMLPIDHDENSNPEIHYTRVFRIYQRWVSDKSLERVFENTVSLLVKHDLVDCTILHGDGSSTAAKKGGDLLGYNGHKHFKGEKVVAIVDRHVNVISPYVRAAGNKNESPLFEPALLSLKKIANRVGLDLKDSVMSLDGAYDSRKNRKLIFNAGMIPNINENKRNRKKLSAVREGYLVLQYLKSVFKLLKDYLHGKINSNGYSYDLNVKVKIILV
jgi:transposase